MYPPWTAVPLGISIYCHMGPARATVGICSYTGPPQATGSIHSAMDPLCHLLLPFFFPLSLSLPPTFPKIYFHRNATYVADRLSFGPL